MKFAILVTAALAAFALPSFAAEISGAWTISATEIGSTTKMKCEFRQNGADLSGICGATKIAGSIADNKVTFTYWPQIPNLYTTEDTYNGTLDAAGLSMKGDIASKGAKGTFSGVKDSTSAQAPARPLAVRDVAGSWRIVGDVVGNAIDMTCVLKADGPKLTGTCTYKDLGDSPTTGSLAGDNMTVQNSVTREQVYDLTYSGVLDSAGTAIKGEIAVAGVTGNFTGAKDK